MILQCSCENSQKGAKESFLFYSNVSLLLLKQLGVCSLSQTCSWLRSVWVFEEKNMASFQCLTWCCSENVCYILSAFHCGWVLGKSDVSVGNSLCWCFIQELMKENMKEIIRVVFHPLHLSVPVMYKNCFTGGRKEYVFI